MAAASLCARGPRRRRLAAAALGPLLAALAPLPAQQAGGGKPPAVGVVERLGTTIPLDLVFADEEGMPVTLRELVTLPTVLSLVYYRCPRICSPLLNEVAHMVAKVPLEPGLDYNLVTISFDPRENHEIARNGRSNLLKRLEEELAPAGRKVPAASWRFLTGEKAAIAALCEAVGFYYQEEDQDYNHPATTIFLSTQGKIVRYLNGVQLLPANFELALLDAMAGRPRSVMQLVQQLCFSYDSEANTYKLKVDRIVLAVTVVGLGIFLVLLLLSRRRRRRRLAAGPEVPA